MQFNRYLGRDEGGFPIFKIDLNDEPKQRFKQPALYLKEGVIKLLKKTSLMKHPDSKYVH